MAAISEIECRVTGRCGLSDSALALSLGYREFVAKKARALWLSGFVENLPQYEVRVVTRGEEAKLEKFLEYVRKGPFGSRVGACEVTRRPPTNETYGEFHINY